MLYINPAFRITIFILLGFSFILFGCTPSESLTTASPIESPGGGATPGSYLPTSTLEPGIITLTPELESLVEEDDPGDVPTPILEMVRLENAGFENQDSSGELVDWHHTGSVEAIKVEDRGRSGDFRLTHQGSDAYQVETWQTVSGLANDWYTLRGWVRSSGGQKEVYIALRCGSEEKRTYVPPTTPGYRWIQLVVSNQATEGQCTVALHSDGDAQTWASFDEIELVPGRSALTVLGADISSLKKSEDLGGVYRYADGRADDALLILKDHGLNYARLRVWVDPADGYHDKNDLLEMALRLEKLDIKLLVDFHYSDDWADPGKQIKPQAWQEYDFERLKRVVYEHTFDVCNSLVEQGTPPDMVQIGNEINAGMLWPDGDYQHMDNLAALLKEGYQAVKDCSNTTLVMLHIAEGGDNDLARWWFGNMVWRKVPFDVIGISYYPFWHGSLGQLQYNLNDISARYDKDVIVVETAYAFTDQEDDVHPNIFSSDMAIRGYPLTPEGQRAMLRDIMAVVRAVPEGRGLGVFYWDATWTAVTGNGWDSSDPESGNAWENQALFGFDERALPALEEFLYP
jgi:arabinogalactan endo-1,4-beta-galactosidase